MKNYIETVLIDYVAFNAVFNIICSRGMTVTNPHREFWPSRESNQRPPILKSSMVLTELCGFGVETVDLDRNDTVQKLHTVRLRHFCQ